MNSLPTKIMVFGRPGSGKSTFAYKLHRATGIPLWHLDLYFYEANWVERNPQEFLSLQQSIVEGPAWIVDGNCIKSLDMRFAKADLVVYFNYPRRICYVRILKRLLYKNPQIKDRAEGCKETLPWRLIRYMWNFEQRIEGYLRTFKESYPHTKLVEIRSDKDLRVLEKELMQNKPS